MSRKFKGLLILTTATSLSMLIEFVQLYFPQRTVSQNDIMAETIGGALGILLWVKTGDYAKNWLASWQNSEQNKWRNLLQLYLAAIFTYAVMPLDLYISPIEMFHKWQEGRIILLPFGFTHESSTKLLYDITTDIVLWLPIPILWRLYKKQYRETKLFLMVVSSAFTIELFQLFVYSRVTDVTDILTASAGALLGLKLSRRFTRDKLVSRSTLQDKFPIELLALIILWLLFCLFLYWYPFELENSRSRIVFNIEQFFSVPFKSYYFTGEYQALTRLLQKVLFAIPMGILVAQLVIWKPFRSRLAEAIIWMSVVGIYAVFELGQVVLQGKTAMLTDLALALVGIYCGRWLAKTFLQTPISTKAEDKTDSDNTNKDKNTSKILLRSFLLVCFILLTGGAVDKVLSLPQLPYNIRELIGPDNRFLLASGLIVTWLWMVGFPLLRLENQYHLEPHSYNKIRRFPQNFTIGLVWHCLAFSFLGRMFLPKESLYDVIGSPTWGVLPELEILMRLCSLFLLFSASSYIAGAIVLSSVFKVPPARLKLFIVWFASCLLSWTVSIFMAGTDNLTELMVEDGYSLYLFVFPIYLTTLFTLAYALINIRALSSRQVSATIILVLLSGPLSYQLINLGLEPLVVKYNNAFSALQFLLSTDRQHYLAENDLYIRFLIAHYTLLTIITLFQPTLLFRAFGLSSVINKLNFKYKIFTSVDNFKRNLVSGRKRSRPDF